MKRIQAIALGMFLSGAFGCSESPYQYGGSPTGYSRYDIKRDYMECEMKARYANENQFYNQSAPFPFGPGPQNPVDHARALHGISTINTMRDTCLTTKGYRLD